MTRLKTTTIPTPASQPKDLLLSDALFRSETGLDDVDNCCAVAAGVSSCQDKQGGGEEKFLNFENNLDENMHIIREVYISVYCIYST